jgi:serine/threonine-protein kinase
LGAGPWSGTVSKSFTVLKPVWLTLPFLLGYLAAGTLAGTGGYAWRRRLRQRAATRLPALADWRMAVLSPDVASPNGTLLDERFEVGGIIARGGFATVYQGRDRRQGLPCAVKIFRHELLENSWMARRFQQEVSALQQIDHVNVVRIYGHGSTGTGAPYLAMEFVDGQTLRDVLSGELLDRARVASYLRQTGSALAEIHARRICHRDLKPENLMIRRSGEAGKDLVLIDFSIAIVQDPDQTLHGLSRAAGTLQYMAPEQAIGYADASSDIYSLAKILLEMLTGERLSVLLPDASMDLPVKMREFLRGSGFGLSEGSIDLVAGALEFDPARRPKDARGFAERIAGDLTTSLSK